MKDSHLHEKEMKKILIYPLLMKYRVLYSQKYFLNFMINSVHIMCKNFNYFLT